MHRPNCLCFFGLILTDLKLLCHLLIILQVCTFLKEQKKGLCTFFFFAYALSKTNNGLSCIFVTHAFRAKLLLPMIFLFIRQAFSTMSLRNRWGLSVSAFVEGCIQGEALGTTASGMEESHSVPLITS